MQMLTIVEMENGQNMNVAGTQDSLIMKTLDERNLTKSNNDILARRQKNRERQRRYRARKRLEADMKKSSVLNHSITPQVDPQLNGNPITPQVVLQPNGNLSNCIVRVRCKRDWKKDARRVSMSKGPEDTKNVSVRPTLPPTTESQTLLSSGNKAGAQAPAGTESHPSLTMVNGETNKTRLGRRDWKAEARSKKS